MTWREEIESDLPKIIARIEERTGGKMYVYDAVDCGYWIARLVAVPDSDENWESAGTNPLSVLARIATIYDIEWQDLTRYRIGNIEQPSISKVHRWSSVDWWKGAHPPKPDVRFDPNRRGSYEEMLDYRHCLLEIEEDPDLTYEIRHESLDGRVIYLSREEADQMGIEPGLFMSDLYVLEGRWRRKDFIDAHRITEEEKARPDWCLVPHDLMDF